MYGGRWSCAPPRVPPPDIYLAATAIAGDQIYIHIHIHTLVVGGRDAEVIRS